MRTFFLLCFLAAMAWGDFFVLSGSKKVQMTPLQTGVIDFATLGTIAKIEREESGIHAMVHEKDFNKGHANFRLASIDIPQSNTSITHWSKEIAPDTFSLEFDGYTSQDGVMLQVFYHNTWHAAVFGEPLEILHRLFSRDDLEPKKAYEAIQRAREAFGKDAKLKELEKVWHARAKAAIDPDEKYKKQTTIDFSKINK